MISKELLSDVLGEKVDFIKSGFNGTIGTENQYRYRIKHKPQIKYINIYELAHKCKEWAYKNGYQISTFRDENNYTADIYEKLDNYHSYDFSTICQEYGHNTEHEAIFKACEWILREKTEE